MSSSAPTWFWLGPAVLHRAAIAGQVIDAETQQALAAVSVSITSEGVPTGVPSQTTTSKDGVFCFADLPPGHYVLSFSLAGYPSTTSGFDVVSRASPPGQTSSITQIALQPTGVRGQVMGVNASSGDEPFPLAMARVRVVGSGETAYGDEDGNFYLSGIEPGDRTLEIAWPGYSEYSPSGDSPLSTPVQSVPIEIVEGVVLSISPPAVMLVWGTPPYP